MKSKIIIWLNIWMLAFIGVYIYFSLDNTHLSDVIIKECEKKNECVVDLSDIYSSFEWERVYVFPVTEKGYIESIIGTSLVGFKEACQLMVFVDKNRTVQKVERLACIGDYKMFGQEENFGFEFTNQSTNYYQWPKDNSLIHVLVKKNIYPDKLFYLLKGI